MRHGIVILLASVLLAACQQPGATKNPADSAVQAGLPETGDDSAGQSRYFAAETDDLRKQIVTGLVGACFSHYQVEPAFNACLRKDIVRVFDDSGQAQKRCGGVSNIDEFTSCVLDRNIALDLLHRIDAPTPTDADFWTSKEKLKAVVEEAVVSGSIENCGTFQSRSAAEACIDRWLTSKLSLPASLLEKCPTGSNDTERGKCLAEAASIRFVQEHVGRLSEMST
jgi:hypothetical protein